MVGWFGLGTMFDFFIIMVVDHCTQETNPEYKRIYAYYENAEGSGIAGVFI